MTICFPSYKKSSFTFAELKIHSKFIPLLQLCTLNILGNFCDFLANFGQYSEEICNSCVGHFLPLSKGIV